MKVIVHKHVFCFCKRQTLFNVCSYVLRQIDSFYNIVTVVFDN
jgi:hypothetical protein